MTHDPDTAWVVEHLPDADPPSADATDRARLALMEHLSAARPVPAPRPHRERGRRPLRRPLRRPVSLGFAAVAAAAAAFVVVNLTSDGHGGSVAEAQAAQILARARTALDPQPGQTLLYTLTDSDSGAVQTAEQGADPQNWSLRPGSGIIEGQENGQRELYDPATNTIYRDASTSMAVGLSSSDVALVDEMNAQGAQSTVDQDATVDGQPATEVTSVETDGNTYQLWTEPGNGDRPLKFVWTRPSGTTETVTWTGYEIVDPGQGTPSPALLTNDYPSATVKTIGADAFSAMRARATADARVKGRSR